MLRPVEPQDIATFYEQQADPAAAEMAVFPSRDRAAHDAHWARVLADDRNWVRTIVDDGRVVGNVCSFTIDGERLVAYWLGRRFWGRGIATRALGEYLTVERERPLGARVADTNVASIRVLQKCGFVVVGEEHVDGDPVKEIILRLDDAPEP
jgi:RimJ/RimL family protein N-acetyltransferase